VSFAPVQDTEMQERSLINENAQHNQQLDPGVCIPCFLHHNNRVVEKIVQQLLVAGLGRCDEKADKEKFAKLVKEVIDRDIYKRSLKHINDSGRFKFPLTEDGKLDDISLSNSEARAFASGFKHLVKVCLDAYDDDEYKALWLDCCQRFNVVAEYLDVKYHFEWDDICNFQLEADKWCDVYLRLTGRDGMMNYIHLLYTGHYSYFLEKYGNLYRYSQQGWENLNSRVKRNYHHNTKKGGGRDGSSKLLPVMYTLVREVLWRFGYLDGLFEHLGYDGKLKIEYGKVMPMSKAKHAKAEDLEKFAHTVFKFAPVDMLDVLEEVEEMAEAEWE